MEMYSSYPLLKGIAVFGLAHIGIPEAVDQLLSIFRDTPNRDIRDLSRTSLLAIAQSTRNGTLKN